MIAIVDYGVGNLASVRKAFAAIGAKAELVRDPDVLARADALVLPGVGNFGHCAREFHRFGLADPVRAARARGVPILGIVENMAVHVCSNCGHVEHIFGADGGKKMAAQYGMDYLGALPLAMQIRLQADSGQPTVVAEPEGEVAQIYKKVARDVAAKIARQSKDFSAKFPTIAISKNT